MPYDRAALNDLIFHNETMLPRSSPGFGEVSLAVAELQGGDYTKAAVFAEAAVVKDFTLAAGWLAKAAADVLAASTIDLKTERAIFCLDRALECAPTCRREITSFFVTSLLGHYLAVLCASAIEQVKTSEDARAAAQDAASDAAWMGTVGLAAAFTAFCSRQYSTKLLSGVVATAAYGEGERGWEDARRFDTIADKYGSAAMYHLAPAQQLLWVSAQMLMAEACSISLLDPMIENYARTLEQTLSICLKRLQSELEGPLLQYVHLGKGDALAQSYAAAGSTVLVIFGLFHEAEVLDKPHPSSKALLQCLEEVFPAARQTEAYQLLASPYSMVTRAIRASGPTVPVQSLPPVKPPAGAGLGCLAFFVGLMLPILVLGFGERIQPQSGPDASLILNVLWIQ